MASGSPSFQLQQQQPSSLEQAQHTMLELQLMARPLKATMAAISQQKHSIGEDPASPMLLCHLRHLERCHPRLWSQAQQQRLPDLWCGAVPLDTAAPADASDAVGNPAGSSSSSTCWMWLSKYEAAEELLSGLQQLRQNITTSSGEPTPATTTMTDNSSSTSSDTATNNAAGMPTDPDTTADPSTSPASIKQQLLDAYESALILLCSQLESLVNGAAAAKAALRSAGLLPHDGRSIRAALQEATAAGQLPGWASRGYEEAQRLLAAEQHDAQDADWLVVVPDGQEVKK